MAAQHATLAQFQGLFKKVYVSLHDMLAEGYVVQSEIAKFDAKSKTGLAIAVPVVLSHENGLTCGGSSGGVITFADPQAASILEALVYPYETFVSSGITTGAASRAAAEGEAAVKNATQTLVKANVKSHQRFIEQFCLYGQDPYGIGRICYQTMTWRGVSLTAGAGTVGGIVFATGGVNTSSNHFLIDPNDWATGLYIGAEGLEVSEIRDSDGATVGTGKIVSVDLENAIVKVDFTPVASSSTTSHYLSIKTTTAGTDGGTMEMFGAKKILSTSGSLFGINNSTWNLWKGVTDTFTGKMTYPKMIAMLAKLVNRGCEKDLVVLTSADSWSDLITEQMALRSLDQSYKPTEVVNGAQAITFHYLNGKVEIRFSRFVRRSDTFIFGAGDWARYGSTDVTMKIPGMGQDGDMVLPPITTNVFIFRTYADQQIFCHMNGHSAYINGIDPDSAS